MARTILTLNRSLTDEQITAMYALAEKFKVGLSLYGNTPSPTRDSFTWRITGSIVQIIRFTRRLKSMR